MDLANSFKIWTNVLTKPSEETFAAERQKPTANLTTALIWVVAAALINFIAQAITFLLFDPVQQFIDIYTELMTNSSLPQATIDEFLVQLSSDTFTNSLLIGLFLGVLLFPIFFLLGSGILWGVARVFGGKGDYSEQTYLISTYYAPLAIINVIASFIPFLGLIVSIAISIYQIILTYFVLRVSHQLAPGKAIGSIVAPIIGVFAFSCCCSFLFIATVASSGA